MDSERVSRVQGRVSNPEGPPWRQTESELPPVNEMEAPDLRRVSPAGSRLAYLQSREESELTQEERGREVGEGVFKFLPPNCRTEE